MRCHENLAMLACAARAREKQHLLGQLLKEIQINQVMLCQNWLYAVISNWGFTNCPFRNNNVSDIKRHVHPEKLDVVTSRTLHSADL